MPERHGTTPAGWRQPEPAPALTRELLRDIIDLRIALHTGNAQGGLDRSASIAARIRAQGCDEDQVNAYLEVFAETAEWGPFRSLLTGITPDIRSAALGHTIAMLRLVNEHGTFEFAPKDTSVLIIADHYARYLATGDHFE